MIAQPAYYCIKAISSAGVPCLIKYNIFSEQVVGPIQILQMTSVVQTELLMTYVCQIGQLRQALLGSNPNKTQLHIGCRYSVFSGLLGTTH